MQADFDTLAEKIADAMTFAMMCVRAQDTPQVDAARMRRVWSLLNQALSVTDPE